MKQIHFHRELLQYGFKFVKLKLCYCLTKAMSRRSKKILNMALKISNKECEGSRDLMYVPDNDLLTIINSALEDKPTVQTSVSGDNVVTFQGM